MLLFDQENQPARRIAYGPSGQDRVPSLIDDLAREIESTQRHQSETLANIVERLRVLQGAAAPSSQPRRSYVLLDEAGDEPWDAESAEQLMRNYETTALKPASRTTPQDQRDWFGSRLDDLTDKISQVLQDAKPDGTVLLLEERLDAFQQHMSTVLKDVVRREDLEGLRLIEGHVNNLGDKLDELERHVARIDGIETDVRNVMVQVSDERIAKLLDTDNNRFASDLETLAKRAADEVENRLAQRDDGGRDEEARRHEELRSLIEASITGRREAEAQAASLVTDLSGRINAQSDRYDELKGLLERAIQEQRQNEQTAFSMLDTLQQALTTVLDRMEALEQQQGKQQPSYAAELLAAAHEPVLGPPPQGSFVREPSRLESHGPAEPNYDLRDARFTGFVAGDSAENGAHHEGPPPLAEVTTAAEYVSDAPESPIERLRRDFVADARRAKLKAAANRAEEFGRHGGEAEAVTAAFSEAGSIVEDPPRQALGTGSGRLFGMSTKLLASVLALIIAINGGLLFLNRNSSPPAAPVIVPHTSDYLSDAPALPAPRSEGDAVQDYYTAPGMGPRSEAIPDDAFKDPSVGPQSLESGSLGSTELAAAGISAPVFVAHGMTVEAQAATLPMASPADIYEQQVRASLSGRLGQVAASEPRSAFPGGQGERSAVAYPAPELSPHDEGTATNGALALPPATVGPMSLRVAAANGDPSAQFEVAARLAEGKGTAQDYEEALRWYQRSAAKGFAQSQYRVGTLYERGLGVGKDLERAKIWYARAAEAGNVKAMHNLAVLIASGEHGTPDYKAALPYFLQAAEHGLADSQYNLGVLLENGLGAKVDRVGAYKWYALAAKAGDTDAIGRRDALKAEFAAGTLAAADAAVAEFRARPASPLANDARAAGEDWKKRVNSDTDI